MIEPDTIKLLRECDAGTQMGLDAFDEILPAVHSEQLKSCLEDSKAKHEKLASDIEHVLETCGDSGKELNPITKGIALVKANIKLAMDASDQTIADMITDGCDMGIKSLTRFLNQYPAAHENAKELAHRLISIEEQLKSDMLLYL